MPATTETTPAGTPPAAPPGEAFEVHLTLEDDWAFRVDFGLDGVPALLVDEPPPLGAGHGPSAKRVLAAAVGNCMAASALFCLRKARVPVEGMRVEVTGRAERNADDRLRIPRLQVRLFPAVALEDRPRMARCLEIFEDFCVVGQSVRAGIDVDVAVVAADPADLAGG